MKKLPWLLLPVLLGGGAAPAAAATSDLGKAAPGHDAAVNHPHNLLLNRGIVHPPQDKRTSTSSARAVDASRDQDALTIDVSPSLPNQPNPKTSAPLPPRDDEQQVPTTPLPPPPPDRRNGQPLVITLRTPSSKTRASRAADSEPPDANQAGASSAGEAGNPASANRVIAGMSAGLVSVMLIFTVFL
ncbi:hypothetical protein VTJ83DRAFT_6633 [Remersonia thermophila]|uniref:Uncharacterized protein n=1 Tax=Remersonia thermophila TaxID=72144 RepID=A0ABR4D598_9PEZI